MKYLKHDDSIVIIENDREELQDYLDFRETNDQWIICFINELAAVGIPNEPLLVPYYCKDIKVQRNGYKVDIDDIDYTNVNNEECIKDTGLFLVFPYRNKLTAFPIRNIAYPTICKRAEDDCGTMYRMIPKQNKSVLPINEKAERLCRDFTLYSNECKILYRDEKVSAVLSKEYAILPANELVEALEDQLQADHPDYTFSRATISHEYLLVEYMLNDEMMEETFRLLLNDAGADIGELKAGLRLSTSDVGMSKVYVTLFYTADNTQIPMPGRVEIEHKGDATIEKFRQNLSSIGLLFKENEERVEALGNLAIKDVAGTVRRIREEYSFLPKSVSEEVEDELALSYPTGGTGIDVYLALNEIVHRHASATVLSPTRYVELTEQTARLLYVDMSKFDRAD